MGGICLVHDHEKQVNDITKPEYFNRIFHVGSFLIVWREIFSGISVKEQDDQVKREKTKLALNFE